MDAISKLCTLLETKKDRFLQYEQATVGLLDCAVEDIENYITRRGALATEINALDEEMDGLCAQQPNGALLQKCARNQVDFVRLPGEYHCVFYGGQAVHTVLGRIAESDKQVTARLEKLRDEALENIRQNQNMPKIRKYLSNLGDSASKINLRDEKA